VINIKLEFSKGSKFTTISMNGFYGSCPNHSSEDIFENLKLSHHNVTTKKGPRAHKNIYSTIKGIPAA